LILFFYLDIKEPKGQVLL